MPDADQNAIVISMLRDQHREILGRISALDQKLEGTRVEIKNDLISERTAIKAELMEHIAEADRKYDLVTKEIEDLKTWRAKAVAYGSVAVFILTFASQALAGGHFPGIG